MRQDMTSGYNRHGISYSVMYPLWLASIGVRTLGWEVKLGSKIGTIRTLWLFYLRNSSSLIVFLVTKNKTKQKQTNNNNKNAHPNTHRVRVTGVKELSVCRLQYLLCNCEIRQVLLHPSYINCTGTGYCTAEQYNVHEQFHMTSLIVCTSIKWTLTAIWD